MSFSNRVSIFFGIVISLPFFLTVCSPSKKISDNKIPEETRFTKVVLAEGMDEPMAMTFLPNNRVLIVERKGGVKVVYTETKETKTITTIPVNTKYKNKEGKEREAEEGLMGIIAHPNFAQNNWIYMYYADPKDAKHILARWELHGDSLYANTKKIVLEVPTQREECCHTGGGMVFDREGNLFLSVGNNMANPPYGTASYDERPGRSSFDDQGAAGNTNDLRGAILRIHPEDDGSYSIPAGNLFPKGTPKTKPELYVKGNRNPWRVSVDSKTGFLYWGEVGPDAAVDSIYGPRGYDEFNQARKAGYFGWPYFIADNKPYKKYNAEDNSFSNEYFNPAKPVNNSPNNTGLKELPLPQKAFIWYPYNTSDKFPMLGSAGRSAVGGPVYRQADFKKAARPWPAYYEGKWLISDFMRGWIMAVSMDSEGNYKSMEPVLPKENFSSVIDMQFGPEGDLYVLEYGSAWFKKNENSRLVRIEYNAGNRTPIVEASSDKNAGAIPLKINLSSKGTLDYDEEDKNKLKYEWLVVGNNTKNILTEANPQITLTEAGEYDISLTVTDTKGSKNTKSLKINAGNEPPIVNIDLLKGNKTFFFANQNLDYAISVIDKEDGSTYANNIKPEQIAVNFDYMPEGFDPIEVSQNHRASDQKVEFSAGLSLINGSDCKSCHVVDKKSIGPSFMMISERYKDDPDAVNKLANKVIKGSAGTWGDHAMSAHPNLALKDAQTMTRYIMSLGKKPIDVKTMPLKGSYTMKYPEGDNGRGGILLRAAYTDQGTKKASPLATESTVYLRNPFINPQKADIKQNTKLLTTPRMIFLMMSSSSHIAFKNIDMTGLQQINVYARARQRAEDWGGIVEIRLDSPTGKLLGEAELKITNSSEWDGGLPKPLSFTFAPINGIHTVYLIAKNPKAPADRSLLQLIEVEFLNKIQNELAKK
jgi:cytochrome c